MSNNLKGTNVKGLSPEPSHSEKSAVKANLEPIISVNVSAVKPVSLPPQRLIFGSHGNCEHGGDG